MEYSFSSTQFPNKLIHKCDNTIMLFILLVTNLAYLPGILISKNRDKIVLSLMFCASILYHFKQIKHRNDNDISICKECRVCQVTDIILATIATIYILYNYHKNIELKHVFLMVFTGLVFLIQFTSYFGTGYKYIVVHSIWHILGGYILYELVNDKNKRDEKKEDDKKK